MSRTAVVTGASRGIGHEICEELARRGWSVAAVVRDTAAASSDEGNGITLLQADVTRESDVAALADAVRQRFGRLDVLVNAAGIMPPSAVVQTTALSDWNQTLAVNTTGPFLLSRAFAPLLAMAPASAIVNVTGMLGNFANGMVGGGLPAYRVSKAALNALSLTLAEELKDQGTRVISYDPGWVRTDMGGPDAPRSVAEVAAEVADYAEEPAHSGVLLRGGEVQQW